jgi:hypothetical protein
MTMRCVLVVAVALVLAAGLTACGASKKLGTGVVERPSATKNIRAARDSRPNFKIFPLRVSSVACRIPRGGPYSPGKMWLDGMCSTQLRTYHPPRGIRGGHGTAGTVEVAFTERWRYGSKRWWHATYIVPVRYGQVFKSETRSTGAAPPQSWM